MNLCVLGLGYVGCVSAAALAARGHRVVGIDVDESKVSAVAAGQAPVVEPGLDELIAATVETGALSATTEAESAVRESDVSIVCVGTPSARSGEPRTDAVERAVATIGAALAPSTRPHTVIVRSTILPGTSERLLIPRLENTSGRRVGDEVGFVFNPEFLREGSSLADFDEPPKTVFGSRDGRSRAVARAVYAPVAEPLFEVPLAVAEMTKYSDNVFHALKVCFANEIGALSRAFGVDSHEVMEIFVADQRLNISPVYLKPGFAFGGSCLPKDVRALAAAAKAAHLEVPIVENVLRSNAAHLQRALDVVTEIDERRVGMFGLAFKSATDDLRESPLLELAERLIGKGFDLKIHDPIVSPSRLVGANRRFVEERLPHLSALLVDEPEAVVEHARVLIVGNRTPRVVDAVATAGNRWIVDLVRLPDAATRRHEPHYVGIAW